MRRFVLPSFFGLVVLLSGAAAWSSTAGTLVVDARPSSAVVVDGESLGDTPIRVELEAGEHEVRLRAPDGRERAFFRQVDAGRETTFRFHWR